MPELLNCEKDNEGNYYCIDNTTGKVIRVIFEKVTCEKVDIETVPPEVLFRLMLKEYKKREIK